MKEIALLPDNLLRMPSVGLVSTWYAKSFEDVLQFETSEPTESNLLQFVKTLNHIRDRHSDVVQTMAQGVLELKETRAGMVEPPIEVSIQYFLDRLYMSRISIRMLINQHSKFPFLLLNTKTYQILFFFFSAILFGEFPQEGRHIGCIDPLCDPACVVRDAYENARFLCDQYYLDSPPLEMTEHNEFEENAPIRIVYVPSHLYHMLFELFKNSMRAVMEHHGDKIKAVPPIKVAIVQGHEDISVKVCFYELFFGFFLINFFNRFQIKVAVFPDQLQTNYLNICTQQRLHQKNQKQIFIQCL